MPLNHNGANGRPQPRHLPWAIALHKLPIALLVTGAVCKAQCPQTRPYSSLFRLSYATWLHTWQCHYNRTICARNVGGRHRIIATCEYNHLIRKLQNHQFNLIKLIFVVAGMALAAWMSTSLNL